MDTDVVDYLPAGHALTGCDSVAKVGTKASMLKALRTASGLIEDFGVDRLDQEMLEKAESFLVKIVAPKSLETCPSFDNLRLKIYQQSRDKKFIQLPCTSNEIQQNIKRAYYQARMWLESPFGDIRDVLVAENYGYDSSFNPVWYTSPQRPEDISSP